MLQDRAWVQNLADRNLKVLDKEKYEILSFAERSWESVVCAEHEPTVNSQHKYGSLHASLW